MPGTVTTASGEVISLALLIHRNFSSVGNQFYSDADLQVADKYLAKAGCLLQCLSVASGIAGTVAFDHEEYLFDYAVEARVPCALLNPGSALILPQHIEKQAGAVELFIGFDPKVCNEAAGLYRNAKVIFAPDLVSDVLVTAERAAKKICTEIETVVRENPLRRRAA